MSEYQLHPGTTVISSPGKFEGEPAWLPELFYVSADSEIWDASTLIAVFKLDAELRALVGASADESDAYLLVWETEQGFAEHRFLSSAAFARFEAECEAGESDEAE
jgi:hypothetical protein